MFSNHLVTAFRNLKRSLFFTFINFTGLSVGIAASLVVFTYVLNQRNYDRFHAAGDRIVRLVKEKATADGTERGLNNSPVSVYYAKDHITGVEDYVLMNAYDYANNSLIYQDPENDLINFREDDVYFTSASFFTHFDYKVIYGNPARAFEKPHQLVLTESVAKKYFADKNPVGKAMLLKNIHGDFEYRVAGVIEDLPYNTHLQAGVLLSFPGLHQLVGDQSYEWSWTTVYAYLVLEPGANQNQVLEQLDAAFSENLETDEDYRFHFQPLSDIYLTSRLDGEFKTNGNMTSVRAFTLVAVLLLLIAWVNYINLSSMKAAERFREIGIRKTLGSSRYQVMGQFLVETALFNLCALLLAILLLQLAIPALSGIIGHTMSLSIWYKPLYFGLAVLVFAVGTFLSGFYAAFIISGYQPVKALSKATAPVRGSWLRRGLVVFQFTLSIVLLCGVGVVYHQITYMQNKKLGINLDDILVVHAPPINFNSEDIRKKNAFKEQVLQLASVQKVSTSSKIPGIPIDWSTSIRPDKKSERSTSVKMIAMDMDYPQLYDFHIGAGRFYRDGDDTFTTGEVLVNQQVLNFLGIPNDEAAIGQVFYSPTFGNRQLTIIGVVQDYHHLALKEVIPPMLYVYSIWSNYYSVKLQLPEGGDGAGRMEATRQAIADIKSRYHQVFGEDAVFDYFFQDQQFDQQYKSDLQFATMFSLFSGLTILIAVMGLFALAYYFSLRKTREIGIHKILGASVAQLIFQLNRTILWPVAVASVLALPLAYVAVHTWLQGYAYRIGVMPVHLLGPVAGVLVLAVLVVSWQTYRTAKTNPVNALRNE